MDWLKKAVSRNPAPLQSALVSRRPSPAPHPTPQLHALLLAPEGPARHELAAFLEGRGFHLITCSTVEMALAYTGPLQFALVALDLPDRPGWQLWNRLTTDTRAPLALFWGEDPTCWERLSLRANNRTAFLQSPFQPKDLLRALVELEQYRVARV